MNQPKGNQKHLTLSQRIEIEKALLANRTFTEIARNIASKTKNALKRAKEILESCKYLL